jgi:branched-subunit amino acid aminotransferase/4-amino-4-deoxychorismate lyase
MEYTHFSHNGKLLPAEQAVVPLSNIAYSYGFGVYETIRVAAGITYFLDEHIERLLQSAQIINLSHTFDAAFVAQAAQALTSKTDAEAYNLKVLLIGGRTALAADLYITCLNPLFPDRKLYRNGVKLISEQCERLYPQAKSLNMFTSYQAYAHAQAGGAYDALLINRAGCITEGTRTNFFGLSGKTLVSPPAEDCLHGVTRHHVMEVARKHGFTIREKAMPLDSVRHYDNVFLTSTPSKIMPVQAIDKQVWEQPVSPALHELMQAYDSYIESYRQRA